MGSAIASLRLAFEKVLAVQEASKGKAGNEMAEAVELCIQILSRAAGSPPPAEDVLDLHEASIQAVEETLPSLKRALKLTLTLQAAASGFSPSRAYTTIPRLRIPGMIRVLGAAISQISLNVRMAKAISSVGRQAVQELLSESFEDMPDPVPVKVKIRPKKVKPQEPKIRPARA